ncbi:MAG TPA: hypothetical protein DCE41_08705 [Cytophagales bacterium]|nr:hypothetical protein [Cytophagales bacterium]HAA19036.1 hypothetical protein [Cytophagales bacterium]HAP64547.1 hypothetical protein [Cytophagales bacterium]
MRKGKQVIPNSRVAGASLVEVTVSMVLLSVIFLAAWMIFGQLIASSSQRLVRSAEAQAEAWLDASLAEQDFLPDRQFTEWGQLERKVSPHPDYYGLVLLEVRALGADAREIAHVQQWVYVEE